MMEQAARVVEMCRRIAGLTEEPGRTTRRFLAPPMHEVHELLTQRMRSLGMDVHVDAAGNLRGLWQPAHSVGKRLVMGSHIDTVPNAGPFDGVLGAVIALEWVGLAAAAGLAIPIEVIAFSEEEGVRFGVPFIGSRAVAGTLDASLLDLRDGEGITARAAIRAFGLNPDEIGNARIGDDVLGFVEVHIEQGPVLESEDLSVAAVSAIAGQTRGTARFRGEANHAGTTPMNLRRDALAAAAEWILEVENAAQRTDGLVATVGKIDATPNATNVIAGLTEVTLDCRHAVDRMREDAVASLISVGQSIAERRGLGFDWNERMRQRAIAMDERLTACMSAAIEDAGLPIKSMTSGAGHDAMVMASRMPAAMLFVRSPGGISHHPDETVRVEDVAAALRVGSNFLRHLAALS